MQAVLTTRTTYDPLVKDDLFLDPFGSIWLVKSPLKKGKITIAPQAKPQFTSGLK